MLPFFGSEADVLHQGRFAVADGKVIGATEGFSSLIPGLPLSGGAPAAR